MMTFTHNYVNDTMIERDGDSITMCFVNDPFTLDTDTYEFPYTQDELWAMIQSYFDADVKNYADIFDELTLPAQDALYNALLMCDRNGVRL